MSLFDTPEEKENKRIYKEQMKDLAKRMNPTGKIFLVAKWDDELGVISVGAMGLNTIIKYETITNVEVQEEVRMVTKTTGKTHKKGVVKRSIVGGVLLGPAGAVIGGATAKSENNSQSITYPETVRTLVVTREDPYTPILSFGYDAQLEAKFKSILEDNKQMSLEINDMLEISDDNETMIGFVDKEKNELDGSRFVADELMKLKSLMEDGYLTQEEFDSQKKKLLGN